MSSIFPTTVDKQILRDVSLGRYLGFLSILLAAPLSLAEAVQKVMLTWNASSSANVAGYKIYYGTSSGSPDQSLDVGNVSTATVSNLDDATAYFFAVAAYNSAGIESQRSNEVSYMTATTHSDSYSLIVNNGSGDGRYRTGTRVTVSADAPTAGQQFQVWEGDTAILDTFTSATTQALIPLRDVTITATYSGSSNATTSVGDSQKVMLTWNASSSANVAGYKIYYGTSSGSPDQSLDVGNVTTATVSNLDDATAYFFAVAAYNSAGIESQRSNEVSYMTATNALGQLFTR